MITHTNNRESSLLIVGDYLFDPDAGLISGPSGAHYVCPRLTALLLYLVDHEGQVIGCRTLSRALWHDGKSHLDSLHSCIRRLRRYFRDSASSPCYIETIPNQGYRLIAPIYSSTHKPSVRNPSRRADSAYRQRRSLPRLFRELGERKVCRSILIYAVVIWGVCEVTSVVAPALGLPSWVESLIVYLGILGFPVAGVLAWIFDITPEGVVRDIRAPAARAGCSGRRGTDLAVDTVLIFAAVVLCVLLIIQTWPASAQVYAVTEQTVAAPAEILSAHELDHPDLAQANRHQGLGGIENP